MNMIRELKDMGLTFSKKQGQCLLVNEQIMERVVETAELTGDELVIDVGTGPGHLVRFTAPACRHYVGVELDPRLYAVALKKTRDIGNCTLIHGDILKNKHELNPEVMDRICDIIRDQGIETVKVVANLPYHVSVPVILNLLVQDRFRVDLMVVMVQREIAGKLRAGSGTAHYKALAVHSRLLAETESVMFVSKDSFFPAPKVESAVLKIIPRQDEELVVPRDQVVSFINFTKSIFNFPKKNIVNCIKHSHLFEMEKSEIESHLAEAGIDPAAGISGLTLPDFAAIYNAFY